LEPEIDQSLRRNARRTVSGHPARNGSAVRSRGGVRTEKAKEICREKVERRRIGQHGMQRKHRADGQTVLRGKDEACRIAARKIDRAVPFRRGGLGQHPVGIARASHFQHGDSLAARQHLLHRAAGARFETRGDEGVASRQEVQRLARRRKGDRREGNSENLPPVDGLVARFRQEPDSRLRRRKRTFRYGSEVVCRLGVPIMNCHFFAVLSM
jgi:hypothetical protein